MMGKGTIVLMTNEISELALWRYDDNNVRPHSSPGNKIPADARRALAQSEGSAPNPKPTTINLNAVSPR